MKLLFLLALILTASLATTAQTKSKGILLEDLTWIEAEKILTPDTVVVIPLGAAAKEHGPHAPSTVDMKKAAKDYHPSNERGLTRNPNGRGVYSATGIYGDATLATKAKGEQITKALVSGILKEIEDLRQTSVSEPQRQ